MDARLEALTETCPNTGYMTDVDTDTLPAVIELMIIWQVLQPRLVFNSLSYCVRKVRSNLE